jgi:uncharacterized protein YegL
VEPNSEVFPIFPVFLLIDVSASMAGEAMDAVNAALPELKKEIESDPTVGEIAKIGVVTFSDQGRTVVPLCDLAEADIPEIMVEGGTNFAAGFEEVKRAIDTGLHAMPKGTPFYRPVVFFMSDGMHQARQDWKAARADLLNWKLAPEIVTFGLGDATKELLQQVTTKYAFMSKDRNPADQVREIMRALLGSIVTTSRSFSDPDKADGLVIEAPSEHFTPLPRMTL